MLGAGVSVARVRGALKKLSQIQSSITEGTIPGRYLVTDGNDIYFQKSLDKFVDLNRGGQMVFCFMIEFQMVRDEAVRELRQLEA